MPGPRTQPGDVNQPIPGAGQEIPQTPEIGGVETAPQAQPSPGPIDLQNSLKSLFAGQTEQPGAPLPDTAGELKNSLGQLFSGQYADEFETPEVGGPGNLTEVAARTLSKWGRNPNEQQRVLQERLGPNYETKIQRGELFFKRVGEKRFRRIDPEGITSVGEAIQDLITDNSPEVADALISGMFMASGATTGAGGGAVAGGGVGAIPGAIAGGVAGAAIGGAVSAGVREGVIRATGAEPTADLGKEALWSAGLNVLTLGAGKLISAPLSKLGKKMKEFVSTSAEARATQHGELRTAFDNYVRETGLSRPKTGAEVGQGVRTAAEEAKARLSDNVATVWKAVDEVTGGKPIELTAAQGRLARILDENDVKVIESLDPIGRRTTKLERSPGFSGKDPEIKAALNDIGVVYEKLAAGKMTSTDFHSEMKRLGKLSGYDERRAFGVEALYRDADQALRQSQDEVFERYLKNSRPDDFALSQTANKQFADQIDEIRVLANEVEKSPEKVVEAIERNFKAVSDAKRIFGPDSEAFQSLAAHWLERGTRNFVHEGSGIVNGPALARFLDKNPDVTRTFLGDKLTNSLKALSKRSGQINYADLVHQPSQQPLFDSIARATATTFSSPTYTATMLQRLFGGNEDMIRYISDHGIAKYAKQSSTPYERKFWYRVGDTMTRLGALGRMEIAGAGGKRYTLNVPSASITAPLIRAGAVNAREEDFNLAQDAVHRYRQTAIREVKSK